MEVRRPLETDDEGDVYEDKRGEDGIKMGGKGRRV